MQYFSKRLSSERKSAKFQAALKRQGGKIQFHVDPADLSVIHVVLPHLDETIRVPVAPKWTEYAAGLSLWHHRRIREFARETSRKANEVDDLTTCKAELIEMLREQLHGRRNVIRTAQNVARMEGVNRIARAGDSSATTVPGSDAHTATQEPKTETTPKLRPNTNKKQRNGRTQAALPPVVDTSAKSQLDTADASPAKKKGYRS